MIIKKKSNRHSFVEKEEHCKKVVFLSSQEKQEKSVPVNKSKFNTNFSKEVHQHYAQHHPHPVVSAHQPR